ncbi:MAG: phospholipase A [Burkholderiaceae bacterium]
MQNARALGGSVFFVLLCSNAALAADLQTQVQSCAEITADLERLKCFDLLAAGAGLGQPIPEEKIQELAAEVSPPVPVAVAIRQDQSVLARHWELDAANKRGIFAFRPHTDNYLMATYNHSPNDDPYEPFRPLTPEAEGLAENELAFQLGFKMKVIESMFETPIDLWFGYTQRSFWQAGNKKASSPFRETNYQPEVMLVIPVDYGIGDMRMRFVNLGFVHQSNGQASLLSRSWNRLYAQAGFEYGNFTLLARAWKRLEENAERDDNRDIIDYMGRGELLGAYRWNGHEVSLLARHNFQTDKGAGQLSWAFPLVSNLKGYVQYFAGYGYTLIDYNAFQRVVGLGVLVEF